MTQSNFIALLVRKYSLFVRKVVRTLAGLLSPI